MTNIEQPALFDGPPQNKQLELELSMNDDRMSYESRLADADKLFELVMQELMSEEDFDEAVHILLPEIFSTPAYS